MKRSARLFALALAMLAALPAMAADKVIKIGYVNTFSGPAGVLGKQYRDAVDLAMEQLGGKMGGIPVQVIYGDDQLKPDIAKSVVERFIERDKVDLVAGFNFSNTLLAALDTATAANKIVISSNAGPSELAGERCSPLFFSVGHQNDGASESLGRYLKGRKIANVYALAPNYQAGKDMIAGFKRGFSGPMTGEVYTQLTQTDYAAELSQIRAANPAAVFVFMPGGNAINFVKQWAQAGLSSIPLYSVYTVDHASLKPIGNAALGTLGVAQYVEDLPNAANKKFVADFTRRNGYPPSEYAAQAFDTAMLINSAVVATKGEVSDTKAFGEALMQAKFDSVRGNFKFNRNHMPIQNYYLRETVKVADGSLGFVTKETVSTAYQDFYVGR
ncbi:MAG TPA: ABC transporter substrate-binding protein, partial [Ramlibacter sp.]|nr:ABC transporter substrate-binding protein [Ramlibacter sp.]